MRAPGAEADSANKKTFTVKNGEIKRQEKCLTRFFPEYIHRLSNDDDGSDDDSDDYGSGDDDSDDDGSDEGSDDDDDGVGGICFLRHFAVESCG